MNVANVIELIKEKWIKFNNSRHLDFRDFIKLDSWGLKPELRAWHWTIAWFIRVGGFWQPRFSESQWFLHR